jgi:hypothetical protein
MFSILQICYKLNIMNNWLLLILSLPTENTTVRMRVWRSVKLAGAVVLRDGVYVLPNQSACLLNFQRIANEVKAASGSVFLMAANPTEPSDWQALFDRSQDYQRLHTELEGYHQALVAGSQAVDIIKPFRKLQKSLDSLQAIDFFPSPQQAKTTTAMTELNAIITALLNPNEPSASNRELEKHKVADFQQRHWATRRHLWVDRLASAWLIQRHIDPAAQFIWLASVADCPTDAIGFDFDGATFSHIGEKITFETLLASFSLETPALLRLAQLVHCLDVGGIRPAETSGIEQVLMGLKTSLNNDDLFLAAASSVFDGLYAAFLQDLSVNNQTN